MISSKVGAPVTGEDFFDREIEQTQIWEYLHGDDLLLLAPRRVGKTSLMLRLRDRSADHGFEACYVSVAGATNEVGFVRKLFEATSELRSSEGIRKRLVKGPVGRIFKRIKKVQLATVGFELGEEDPWEELGAGLAEALDRHEGRRLILIDEVPVFVLSLLRADESGERARRFLSWFRDLRQSPDRTGRLRWLLAGSVGLDTVTARLGLGDTINDLYLMRLGPFSRDTARSFLYEMSAAYGFPIPEEALEHMLDRVGWLIPYYLQLLHRELRSHCSERRATPSIATVDAVFEGLLSPSKKAYFDYWRQRLDDELGKPDAGLAQALLDEAAKLPEGVSHSSLKQLLSTRIQDEAARTGRLRYLIDVLVSDGYLVEDGERYRFLSPLLREFWALRVSR